MPVGIAAAALVACQLIAGCGSSGSGGQFGQPPAVLLRVYTGRIDGHEQLWNARIGEALQDETAR